MKSFAKRAAALLCCLAFIIPQAGCGGNTDFFSDKTPWSGISQTGYYLDTVCTVTVYGVAPDSALGQQLAGMDGAAQQDAVEQLIGETFRVCHDYETKLSKTVAGSDVDRINKAGGQPVAVGPDALAVIRKGIDFGDLSGGAFDITIGKASELWDFHQESAGASAGGSAAAEDGDSEGSAVLPDSEALAEAVTHVDYRQIEIDEEAGTVRLADPDMEIDLGGIAKGYIADRLSEYLAGRGVTSAVIDLGGNVVILGGKAESLLAADDASGDAAPGDVGAGEAASGSESADGSETEDAGAGEPADDDADGEPANDGEVGDAGVFLVGIKDPEDPRGGLLGTLACRDRAVVTSGTYERFVEKDGVRYHHILDVATGWPVDTDISSVTIIAPLGMSAEADGLSTTCLALGMEKALALLETLDGVEAVLVDTDGYITETSEGVLTRR